MAIRLRSACDPLAIRDPAIRLRSACDPLAIHLRSTCDPAVISSYGPVALRGLEGTTYHRYSTRCRACPPGHDRCRWRLQWRHLVSPYGWGTCLTRAKTPARARQPFGMHARGIYIPRVDQCPFDTVVVWCAVPRQPPVGPCVLTSLSLSLSPPSRTQIN